MKNTAVRHNQTLLDIALQVYGDARGVFWLVEDNALSGINDTLSVGKVLHVRETVINNRMRDYLQPYTIATGEGSWGSGIGFWAIGKDFVIINQVTLKITDMKIEKLANGNVLFKDDKGDFVTSLSGNMKLHLHPRDENALLISNSANNQDENNSYVLYTDDVVETILKGTATPFSGTRTDLAMLLSEIYFFNTAGKSSALPTSGVGYTLADITSVTMKLGGNHLGGANKPFVQRFSSAKDPTGILDWTTVKDGDRIHAKVITEQYTKGIYFDINFNAITGELKLTVVSADYIKTNNLDYINGIKHLLAVGNEAGYGLLDIVFEFTTPLLGKTLTGYVQKNPGTIIPTNLSSGS